MPKNFSITEEFQDENSSTADDVHQNVIKRTTYTTSGPCISP